MRKLRLVQKPIVMFLWVAMFVTSCRKMDIAKPVEMTIQEKFFTTNRTNDAVEKKLVSFLAQKDQKQPFAEETVKKIGYPRWDKLMKKDAQTNSVKIDVDNESQKRTMSVTSGSVDVYYVPFVRDEQNSVNAVMMIHASSTDTTISYACDWQYASLLNVANDPTKSKARNFAFSFMRFDKMVFGHTKFKITNRALFASQGRNAPPEITVELDKKMYSTTARLNVVYQETCQDFVVTFRDCPYIQDPSVGHCYGPNGTCDGPSGCARCPLNYYYFTQCEGQWMDDGSAGGSGGSGGGGGTGSTPPDGPCGGVSGSSRRLADEEHKITVMVVNPNDPCAPGWEPTGGGGAHAPIVEMLSTKVLLTSEQADWLDARQNFAQDIWEWLGDEEEMTFEVKKATLITIDMAMEGLIPGAYTSAWDNITLGYLTPPQTGFPSPAYFAAVARNMAMLKIDHPGWSDFHLFWEATKETVQTGLDVIGLFPVIGEIADLANGIIYSINGDGTLAALSYASAIPVLGWWTAGAKAAKRTIAISATRVTTLKWVRRLDGIINFGSRAQLRRVLNLTGAKQAHHIIPWEFIDNTVIQTAAKGPNPFHMNEFLNGIALDRAIHIEGMVHSAYNTKVEAALLDIVQRNAGNLTPAIAKQELEALAQRIRTAIVQNPGVNLNNISF
jgi:hypothetical protein